MNLMEESFQNKEEKKAKKTAKIVLIFIILMSLIIVSLVTYLLYVQSTTLKLTLNGQVTDKLKQLLVFEADGTIYLPIKEVSSYLGYESYNGEYKNKSEELNKCYIETENEVANFTLGSNKVYKLNLSNQNNNYEYVYIKKSIIAKNGILYISSEGLEKAFNLSFQYDQDKNRITIVTMPYLIEYYTSKVLDYGYATVSDVFVNKKTVLQDMLVVKKEKDKEQYGVIDINGNIILESKYDKITYLTETGDFLVESGKKVGILSKTKETKVQIMYDKIELMDSDTGLYIVQKDNKYGVIDIKGNIKIYIENDEIGIDTTKFEQNNIKNKYLLVDNLIPVRKDKLWGLYDKYGNKVIDYKYDGFGYIASSNKNAINLLVIPNYQVIVASKEKKYTLINSSGEELFAPVADDIYMTISGGEKHYYIAVNDESMDAEIYLDRRGVTQKQKDSSNQTNTSTENNTQTNTSEQNNTQTQTNTSEENNAQEETNDSSQVNDNQEQTNDNQEQTNDNQNQE